MWIMKVSSPNYVRQFVRRWRKRYPFPYSWIDNAANRQCRKSEEKWLASFEGASRLKQRELVAIIEWRFVNRLERERALRGVTGARESGHAQRCIKKALAEKNAVVALDRLLGEEGGIPGWGLPMASTVLAVCQPETYLIADHRTLRTIQALNLFTPGDSEEFGRTDWMPYLRLGRKLAASCGVSLRQVGYAFRAAADQAPALPSEHRKKGH
jgi:hypothetical protein